MFQGLRDFGVCWSTAARGALEDLGFVGIVGFEGSSEAVSPEQLRLTTASPKMLTGP